MSRPTSAPPLPGPLCPVHVGDFEGPLDLLVHLIRTESIPIAEVPLCEVVRQYDRYLELMRELDLEAAGECLVLVAALIYLKSKRLLPPDPSDPPTAPDDDRLETVDASGGRPIQRAVEILQEREAMMELVFPRPASAVAEYAGEQGIEADLFSLLKAFQEILRRVGADPASRVARERVSLADRMNWLLETLQRERSVGFRRLFEGLVDRLSCILTFLALLELIRLRLARAFPSHGEEDILILLPEATPPAPAPEETAVHV
jgi:segregation and condensation protein A